MKSGTVNATVPPVWDEQGKVFFYIIGKSDPDFK